MAICRPKPTSPRPTPRPRPKDITRFVLSLAQNAVLVGLLILTSGVPTW